MEDARRASGSREAEAIMDQIEYHAHMARNAELQRQAERQRVAAAMRPPKQAREPAPPRRRATLLRALRPSRAS
jgi:hypothetical protein